MLRICLPWTNMAGTGRSAFLDTHVHTYIHIWCATSQLHIHMYIRMWCATSWLHIHMYIHTYVMCDPTTAYTHVHTYVCDVRPHDCIHTCTHSNFNRMKLSQFVWIGSHVWKFQAHGKFTPGSYAMTEMAVKRLLVIKKHRSAFALFSNSFCPQTDELYP